MKKIIFLIIFIFSFIFSFEQTAEIEFALEKLQQRSEIYFSFQKPNQEVFLELSEKISIDNVKNNKVFAYANSSEFEQFLTYNISFEPVYSYYNVPKALTMATTVSQMANWDKYPTFTVYQEMMQNFATNYPDICRLDTIGFSQVGNRPILCIVISDNINSIEDEPHFLWSGTMHGDELTGWILEMRLADYLLSNYGTDSQVTNIVNNAEIYICPMANPDGTYRNSTGGTNISNSTRYNGNNVDLNRNFPCVQGQATTMQSEINSMIQYADLHNFTMSANTHGGATVANYPWDFVTSSQTHADDNWWQFVSHIYADLAIANGPTNYFKDVTNSGITEGGDWYVITGSRQDYMNYFKHCREITLELSVTKMLGVEQLNNYWNYNRQAMLNFTEQVLYGFHGIVTDQCSEMPISDVKVEITGHDNYDSEVYSFSPLGNYYRPIYTGTYQVTFSKAGYISQTIQVSVTNNNATIQNVVLVPSSTEIDANFTANTQSSCDGNIIFTANEQNYSSYLWDFGDGNTSTEINPQHFYNNSGNYSVTLSVTNSCEDENQHTENNFVEINLPTSPQVTNGFACESSEITLNVSGNGLLNWYDMQNYGNVINTGNTFTDIFSASITYYVESVVNNTTTATIGKTNNSGNGGNFNNSSVEHGLNFNAYQDFIINSVLVYTGSTGNRKIKLVNSSGAIIKDTIVYLANSSTGITINLNFFVPQGNGYKLILDMSSATINMYRNTTGGNYPYTFEDVVSIIGNTADDLNYYYYFYNWQITIPKICISARVPITATINPTIILENHITNSTNNNGSITVNVIGGQPEFVGNWSNEAITFGNEMTVNNLSSGYYSVTVTDGNNCTKSLNDIWVDDAISIEYHETKTEIYPNPSTGKFIINSDKNIQRISIINENGIIIYSTDCNSNRYEINQKIASGIYILNVETEKEILKHKLIIE
ncbi:MAG: T9SS type A sorting domain-containing protein [Bacteroidales bacterium]|jgi:PKD repeat protein|nr:T9SS type A sorting domain-containing protein [Bacteroidales bacterium]